MERLDAEDPARLSVAGMEPPSKINENPVEIEHTRSMKQKTVQAEREYRI